MSLKPGDILYGYCNGYFGRDSYDNKTVIAAGKTNGERWVVVSVGNEWSLRRYVSFAFGFSKREAKAWKKEEEA